jgi:hypothetical protein
LTPGNSSVIQGHLQFFGKLSRAEGTAGEMALAYLDCGNLSPAVVRAQYELFGLGIILDVYFLEMHATFF